jgi:hypothetical protein
MKTKDLKRKLKAQPGGSLEPVGSAKWTECPPNRPGYYWWRGGPECSEAYVVRIAGDIDARLWTYHGPYQDASVQEYGGQWAGPLLPPNDQHQRREPAATDVGIGTELNGWLPSAECCGSAPCSLKQSLSLQSRKQEAKDPHYGLAGRAQPKQARPLRTCRNKPHLQPCSSCLQGSPKLQ